MLAIPNAKPFVITNPNYVSWWCWWDKTTIIMDVTWMLVLTVLTTRYFVITNQTVMVMVMITMIIMDVTCVLVICSWRPPNILSSQIQIIIVMTMMTMIIMDVTWMLVIPEWWLLNILSQKIKLSWWWWWWQYVYHGDDDDDDDDYHGCHLRVGESARCWISFSLLRSRIFPDL